MKIRQFSSLLLFELRYQFRTKAVYLFALVYFCFSYLIGTQGAVPAGVNFNSEYVLFFKMGLLSLGAVFSIMFFVTTAILRESKSGMEPLIYATPLTKYTYFFSRFTGAWIVGVLVVLIAVPGFYFGLYFSGLDPNRITSFQWDDTFAVIWMLLIPSISICTVLLFSVCLLTKNPLATYATAVIIYALYFISAIFLNSPLIANAAPISSESLYLPALADPFGLSAFFEQTNLWTPFQKNQEHISFISLLGLNRLIWLGISGFLLAACYRKFSFRTSPQRKPRAELYIKNTESASPSIPALKKVDTSIKNYFPITISLIRIDLKFILQSVPFWAIMGTWIVLAVTEIYSKIYAGGAYDENYYPASQLLLEQVQQPLYLFGILLLVFFSGELVWRAKNTKFHEILGAAPTPNSYFFFSKLAALSLMILFFIGVTVLISFGFQIVQGYVNLDSFALFSLLIYPGFSLLFYALLFLLVQNFCHSNYLGMGISVLAFAIFAGPLGTAIGLNHPLLKVGDLPPLNYSQQATWEMNSIGFWILALLWTILAVATILLLAKHWTGSISRIKEIISWNKPTAAGIACFAAFIALTGFCFYEINQIEGYQSRSQLLDQQESYELSYKKFEKDPVLSYSSLNLKVDLFPSEGTYQAQVKGKLKNNSPESIERMLLTEKEALSHLWIEHASKLKKNELQDVYEIEFENPVKPQEELAFSFEVKTIPLLFSFNPALIKDGSYLNFRDFAPYFGYAEGREINDNQEREKRGLPLKPDGFAPQETRDVSEINLMKVDFEAEISTESGQTALTSGELIAEKTEGNRTFFHFKSPEKIMPAIAVFSGKYQIESHTTNNIQLQVYTLPAHSFAAKETLKTMETSLDFLSESFGKYPYSALKIVEIPSYWGFGGFAHPGVISMVEDNFFLVKPKPQNQFDLQRKRAIHEVSHQWFGHLLAPRNIPGASLFVEGFAKYSEALVLQKAIGESAFWNLTDNALRTYFSGRAFATETEPPLSMMMGQGHLSYGKSLSSLLAARELLGEKRLNAVIRKLVDESRDNPLPKISMADFLQELKGNTSAAENEMIRDWFEKVIHYEISIEGVNTKKLPDGEFEFEISYSAKKLETLANGSVQEVQMSEPIVVALLSDHPKEPITANPIISDQKILLKSGNGKLRLVSKMKPNWIALDPWGTRPDQNRTDNFVRVD